MRRTGFATSWLAFAILVPATVACGHDDAAAIDAPTADAACTASGPVDLGGRFATQARLSVHVQGIATVDAISELLLLLDTTQRGSAVDLNARLCDIDIPEIPIQDMPSVRFTPGPGLLASIEGVDGSASLSAPEACASFESQPITLVLGARVDPPDSAPLPQSSVAGQMVTIPDCQPAGVGCATAIGTDCVCDQEQDGKPAATLLVANAPLVPVDEAYVDLRTTFSLSGQVRGADAFQGTIVAALEQGVVHCHVGDPRNEPCDPTEVQTIQGLNPSVTQNDVEPSTFRAVRVDPGLTCDQLLAMKDTIFPR
jgi:hypothetical protein